MARLSLLAPLLAVSLAAGALVPTPSRGQSKSATPATNGTTPPDENLLGEFVVTGVIAEHVPKLAILPSLSSALEDVVVRAVVRRDLELSGLFDLIPDKDAPAGLYGYNDPVDVAAFQKLGAEAIVKLAAREAGGDQIEVRGIAYFTSAGASPVYETKLKVQKSEARRTAHRITDDLLGALTGRPGGFSSRFTYAGPWGRSRRVFTVDADGYGLAPRTPVEELTIGPTYGPGGDVFYGRSKDYSPFRLFALNLDEPNAIQRAITTPYKKSIYSVAFDTERKKMAVALAEADGSGIYVSAPDGTGSQRVSTTQIATHPAFSPSGKLAWVGGGAESGGQRVYVDGKAVSPAGFSASSPTFCDTEDGILLVYSVAVGSDRHDLVIADEVGRGLRRLTQNQGSNTYPACSPDGRLLAFFSERKAESGLYVLSLKRWTTKRVLGSVGESLRWDPLPRAK